MKTLLNRPDDGRFIPSQVASNEEYLGLAEVLSEFGVGSIGWTRGAAERPLPPGEVDLLGGAGNEGGEFSQDMSMDPVEGDVRGEGRDNFLIEMAKAAGRPLQWGAVTFNQLDPERYKEQLAFLERARGEGALMYAQTTVTKVKPIFELAEYNGFDGMPNWIDPFVGTPEERIAKLKTPGVRERMKKDLDKFSDQGNAADVVSDWNRMRVVEVRHERNFQYEGLGIGEVAEMMGKEPMDAFLDLALDEDLRTEFQFEPRIGGNPEAQAEIVNHPFTHPCISDGGAHVRYLTLGSWPVDWINLCVRERQIMSLEKAHYKISGLPAWIAGFTDRGILREGYAADIIVYEPEKLGLLYDSPVYDNDFPGEERRLIQKAKGIRYTIVNGTVTFEDSVCTDATPGKFLRSYDMVSR
jgi:hypothetical protein